MKHQVRRFDPVIVVCSVCELPMPSNDGKDKYPTCVHEGNHAPLLRGSDAPKAIYRLKVESGLLPGRYTQQTAHALALAALTRAGVLVGVVPEGSTWFVALKVTDWYRRGYSPAYIAKRLDVSERYVWKLIRAYDKSDDDVRQAWKRGDVGVITVLRSIGEVA